MFSTTKRDRKGTAMATAQYRGWRVLEIICEISVRYLPGNVQFVVNSTTTYQIYNDLNKFK